MSDHLITAKQLTAAYGSKLIWQDANFQVATHEFIGLLGPNGAGKTTLFKLILGLTRAAQGQLKVLGVEPSKANSRIGYVPQKHQLDSESRLIAVEYVRLGLYGSSLGFSLPKKAKQEQAKALEALKQVDAEDLANLPLNQLSGGEAQRVYLAQALVGQPELLLLDEPLANLDIRSANRLIGLIKNLVKDRGLSVVLIAHDINPLLPAIDRIIYVANKKVATGSIAEVVNSQSLSRLYGAPIEVMKDRKGRLAVLGIEEAIHHE